jgi:PKD repeat protein
MLSALLVSVSGTYAQAGFTSVWAVDDGEKIFRDNITSPLKNGNSVWNGSSVSLFGSRNEIVAFQLILQADASGATNADVQISDLTSGGNTIRGSHPLLAANNYIGMGVELFTEHYLNVSLLSGSTTWGYFNWSNGAAPSKSGMTTGWMPDALVPFSAASGKGGAPFTITANQNQGVWVDVYIGRTLPAGTYTGTITVKLNGATERTIPISLVVYSGTLSDTNHYQSMVFFSPDNVGPRHNVSGSAYWTMMLNYERLAHRHRVDLIGSGTMDEINNGFNTTLTGSAYTSGNNYAGPGEGVGNTIFSVYTYGGLWGSSQATYRTETDTFENWFAANAPNVTRFLYMTDEPGSGSYAQIQTEAGYVHNNPGPGKNLPVFVTSYPYSGLNGAIDVYCSPSATYTNAMAQQVIGQGDTMWSYAAWRPKEGADITDDWGIAFRLKPWVAHKWNVPVWFTWESTHYSRNPNETSTPTDSGLNINVWVDPFTFHTSDSANNGNGDGLLIYPGQDYIFTSQNRQYAGPIASIRLKMYRRGIQDAEYMWLAEQAGKSAQVQNILTELLPHSIDNAVENPDWSNSNAPYDAARRDLALMLEASAAPSPRFKVDKTQGSAPLTVQFTDLSVLAPTSWTWTFGDGTTSTSQSPSHTYSSAGVYTVSLTVSNAQGQNSKVKTGYITAGTEVTLYPSSWSSGGGTTIVSGSLTNLQANDSSYMVMQPNSSTKNYDVTYSATSSYSSSQIAKIILEYDVKRSNLDTPGGFQYVQKSDSSMENVNSWMPFTTDCWWTWQTTSPATYMTSGNVLAFRFCGCANGTSAYTISSDLMRWRLLLTQSTITPIANFVASPRSGAAPLAVAFTDASSNAPTSWSWNFGDSSTSTSQNPSHTYTSGGNYTVSLRATNSAGYDDESKASYISVSGSGAPVANFTGNPTSGTAPLNVAFTDSSSGSPTSWSWNFGDSSTSTSQNPSHTYAVGTYTVSLRATNAGGYDDEVKTNYITANAVAPVAAFSGTPTSGNAPLSVSFTDSSTNTPTSWSWNFGDSSTSTSQNPSHSYAAGTYTVSLRATNAAGYDDEVKTNYISASTPSNPTFVAAGAVASNAAAITPALPAGIAANDILLLFVETYNQAVTIANQNGGTWTEVTNSPQGTTGTRLTAFWSRYNGTQGAPTTSDSGNHQAGRMIAIRGCVTSGNPWDVTAGGVESTSDTSGSIPGATTTVANTLVVTAIATDLPDSNTTTGFSAWANANLTSLTERTDNTRSAGNGGGLGVASGVKAAAGAYGNTAVTCATSARKGMMSIALKPTGGGSAPVAAFSGAPTSGTAPLNVTFTDSSTNSPTSWSWNFGDSSTSTSQNPSHSYAAGTYTVSLRATNAYGYDDEVKTNYITASPAGSPPVANFSGTPVNGQVSLVVAFTDSSTNTPTSWSWNFGDSTTSTSQNPSHTYAAVGDYTVSLRATNAAGYDDEVKTNYITVSAANEVIVYPDTWSINWYTPGCALQSGALSDLTTDNDAYMVIRCDTSTQRYGIMYTVDTIYTPAQVSKITYEYRAKMSRSDTPTSTVRFTRKSDGVWEDRGGTWLPGTSEAEWTWNTTAVSTYMDSSGVIGFELCCCPANTNNYDVSSDKMRFRLQLQ